jgi:hypothetical protein
VIARQLTLVKDNPEAASRERQQLAGLSRSHPGL